jgi:hypothetical protein
MNGRYYIPISHFAHSKIVFKLSLPITTTPFRWILLYLSKRRIWMLKILTVAKKKSKLARGVVKWPRLK